MKTPEVLFVWALEDPTKPRKVGQLLTQGTPVFSYDPEWIATGYPLSPGLRLTDTEVVGSRDHPLPGALRDAMPDRWGQRMIAYLDPSTRNVDVDFLWRAGDRRFGALGISDQADMYHPYPSAVSQLDDLNQLDDILDRVESRDFEGLDETSRKLLASSQSMGGAQPKALVQLDGREWIAKFSRGGVIDLGVAEYASLELAKQAGIRTPQTQIMHRNGVSVVLIERFDRVDGQRVHAISANTLLQDEGASSSYVNLAQALRKYAPLEDREELFRRLALNVLLDNTDDHDRNHALLKTDRGWTLSPVYDVLPQLNGADERGMMVVRARGSSQELAMAHAAHFGLKPQQAQDIWAEVRGVVAGWKETFAAAGMVSSDLDRLEYFLAKPEQKAPPTPSARNSHRR